ncbi:hypothetical protein CYG68_18140 [Morganella morganii]|uniref:HTH cro/C1-type domain-containing protein n=1 Tax=Morganella morganii TaxID=582 RepID=A0A8I0Q3K2_MORMO|nr:helix-turn-helix transcriptional regulator [Morganella morganii]MBE8614294.1 hypothetical protein [Morganella morganii]
MKNKDNRISASAGRRIKEARKSRRIPGKQLAQRIGVSQQQLSRYESGGTPLTLDMVFFIAHVLDISVSELLSDLLPAQEKECGLILANYNSKNS